MNVKDYRRQVEAEHQASAPAATRGAAASPSFQTGPDWAGDLKELLDPKGDPREREAALWRLQAGTFLMGQFAQDRAPYRQALQTAATDPDEELRHAAFDVLTNSNDDFARRALTEGLNDPAKALLSPTVALGLLARDDHNAAAGFAHAFLSGNHDADTRAVAARILGADPANTTLLTERMRDKNEYREVRRASAVALHSANPTVFRAVARDILADDSDFPEIKASVRGALERDEPASAGP